ncbi:MAG: signal peptidase I [Chloroflexota bacterium]
MIGNATQDARPYRGWFVGHFVPSELGPRSTDAVEMKWATHAAGETRSGWAASTEATSLSLLVRGCIRIFFATGEEALLAEPGDYVLWPPGLAHRWQIEKEQTIVLTVRWPSHAGDVVSS